MNIEMGNKLNKLLQYWQPGVLFFSSWLKKNGYSDQLMQQYRKSGWFSMLSKGVMYRMGDKLSSYVAITSYNTQVNKFFYVGAHSALELSGFNHFVPMGKPVLMIGHPQQDKVPDWMKDTDFDYELKFFSTKIFSNPQLTNFIKGDCKILASAPEQAFLECLLLAPNQYAYIDLFYIMEQLTTFRSEVVQELLENTGNIKIKRLFLYLAQKAGHEWFDKLDKTRIELGTGKQKLSDNGVYLPEFLITIPKELYEYE
ncbi:MAG: type IV toxin-antitoxin system AbiEi family antitoxin domain-containing protein [Bacteroidota bacterium]|nr:type IV toxin-antitoxin system AbiEi family antitoxin domain-containing protein [Bacteroidota bacterium]